MSAFCIISIWLMTYKDNNYLRPKHFFCHFSVILINCTRSATPMQAFLSLNHNDIAHEALLLVQSLIKIGNDKT